LASRPSNNRGIPPISSIAEIAGVAQLGVVVDPAIVFPPEFPYTTGNTKALRDNFVELYRECSAMLGLPAHDLIVDIGSNDSTLLANFKAPGHRVVGIEPTDVGDIANKRDISTLKRYFNLDVAREIKRDHGQASVITATNCFAHIEDVHGIMEAIVELLEPGGVFIVAHRRSAGTYAQGQAIPRSSHRPVTCAANIVENFNCVIAAAMIVHANVKPASEKFSTAVGSCDVTVVGGAGHVGIPLVLALADAGLRVLLAGRALNFAI
jgi:SAM-dependent methyltransferase